jgi:hypothetical protein
MNNTFEDIENYFKENCNKGFCLRKTFKSKQCLKESKQNDCFKKWNKQNEKDSYKQNQVDEQWEEVKSKVLERDKSCLVEKCLSKEEKQYILDNFEYEYEQFSKTLTNAHIISRSTAPQLTYDIENIILISMYFHSLMDRYRDLVTQEGIDRQQRESWINRIMHTNMLWNEGYEYEEFKKGKIS